jgi:hypothetical protein
VNSSAFAAGPQRSTATRVEAALESVAEQLRLLEGDAEAGAAGAETQMRGLKRAIAAGVTALKHATATAASQQRHAERALVVKMARKDRDERYLHQRAPHQQAQGADRGAKRKKNTRLGPKHANFKRMAKEKLRQRQQRQQQQHGGGR